MTGQRSNSVGGLAFGQDPLEDPLVVGWDAVVGRAIGAPQSGDSDDVALLRRLHAQDTVPLPSPGFFADLERKLAALPPTPVATRKGTRSSSRAWFQNDRPAALAPGSIPRPHHWTSIHSALVALSVMLVVSLLVLYQAVPGPSEPPPIPAAVIAKPSIETIAQFAFAPPRWGMPDATEWTHMETAIFNVASATTFTTDVPWFLSIDGPLSLTVLHGELTVTPAGPSDFHPANQSGQPPVEVPAGETVSIGPDDTIVFSSADTATVSNPASEPALALYSLVGKIDKSLPGQTVRPREMSFITFDYIDPILSVPTKGATVTMQRLELAPFDTFVFEPDAELRYLPFIDPAQTDGLRIDEGAVEGLVPQPGAQRIYGGVNLRYLKPGPHTIFNLGDETKSIYFLVIEPIPDGGTPDPVG